MKFKASVKTSLILERRFINIWVKTKLIKLIYDYTEQFKELHNTLDHQLTIDETSELLMFYQKVLDRVEKETDIVLDKILDPKTT